MIDVSLLILNNLWFVINMNYDNLLLKILLDVNNKILGGKIARIKRRQPNVLEYLNKKYNDSYSLKETLFRMKYHIDVHPKCPVCGKPTKFYGMPTLIFAKHCSNKCNQNDKETREHYNQVCLKKYGVKIPIQSKEIQEKRNQNCLNKYGVENIAQLKETKEKYKQTCLKKYGVSNPFKLEKTKINSHSKEAKEKQRKTCLKKYGVENSFQSIEVRNKYKENYKRKYGVENPFQNKEIIKKIKQTCLKKYGVDIASKSDIVKEKYKQTCLKRYGVESTFQNEEILNKGKQTCLKRYGYDRAIKNPIISNKAINKRIMNGTWSSSKPEEELYLYIKEKFPDVKRQYKDKVRYPYFCDFYIPELDLFLELNGTWTHGKHPYDMNSKEDNTMLNIWKEKSKDHPMYLSAIKTWTISDVSKRNKAKENNLNFKEVWSLDEGKEFINKLSKSN